MEESINALERRIVRRYCFNIKWPKTLSNQGIYKKTKIVEWKKNVTVRRLTWFGKMARTPEEIPVKFPMRYGLSKYTRPWGKLKTTWISKVKENLNEMNLSGLEAENLAIENYNNWIRTIKRHCDIWKFLQYLGNVDFYLRENLFELKLKFSQVSLKSETMKVCP